MPFAEPVRSGEGPGPASSSTTDVAKDEAANLKDVATGAGQSLGAEINADAEQQTAADTTRGEPKPLGQRGAVKANSVPDPNID